MDRVPEGRGVLATRGTGELAGAPGGSAAAARFVILGPLEVHDGHGVYTPSAHKPRVLLAILLVHRNRVVSVDSLVDELWGSAPPRTAVNALRVYISQLRRVIERLPAGWNRPVLVTREPGYRLQVDQELLDMSQFERLCAAGYARKQNHPELAIQYYAEALALWRGAALCDVQSAPLLRNVAQRLEETRIAALEHRIDLDMRLRRHAEAIAELRSLTAEYPLHEGVHARLMLALYLTGRTGEALETHRRLRSALIEELGVEPSRRLRLLHEAVLSADDPALMRWDAWIP
jgi:DNA-binding SARP family transcriptional activator